MPGHFTLDVDPDRVRAVKRRWAELAEHLRTRGRVSGQTPGDIGEAWTGGAASSVKAEMTALGELMRTFAGHFVTATKALGDLAHEYDEGLAEVERINTRYAAATATCATATGRLEREYDKGKKALAESGHVNRYFTEELGDAHSTKVAEATGARDRAHGLLEGEYDDLVARMRRVTQRVARELSGATHVKVPKGVMVSLQDPTTADSALAAALDAAEEQLGDDLGLIKDRDEQDDLDKLEEVDRLMELSKGLELRPLEEREDFIESLAKNMNDPEFAGMFANNVDIDVLARTLTEFSMKVSDRESGYEIYPDQSAEDLDADYAALVRALGTTYGQATFGTGDYALAEDALDGWLHVITQETSHMPMQGDPLPGQSVALAQLVNHGTWNPAFLKDLTAGVVEFEREEFPDGTGWDQFNNGVNIHIANGGWTHDPVLTLLSGLAHNRVASQWLLAEGEMREISANGEERDVSDLMAYLLMERHWTDGGEALKNALGPALAPLPGDDVAVDLNAQLKHLMAHGEEMAAELKAQEEANDKPWYVDLGHGILDVAGLVPFLGEPADLVNGTWYAQEGRYLEAGLSYAGVVPFLGWGAVGGKWAKGLKGVEGAADLTKLAKYYEAFDAMGATYKFTRTADDIPVLDVTFKSLDDLNAAATIPQANMIYRVDDMVFQTDEFGRVISATNAKVTISPGQRRQYLQGQIGKEGADHDVGFHLLGDLFGGPTNRLNVVPGNGKPIPGGGPNLNQGPYKMMEGKIADAVRAGSDVEVAVVPKYGPKNTSGRPDVFEVEVVIDGIPRQYRFDNVRQ